MKLPYELRRALVVDRMLDQRLADALRDAAVHAARRTIIGLSTMPRSSTTK